MKRVLIFALSISILYGCEEIVSVPDISQEVVEVLAPIDGSVLENEEVTFSWNEIEFVDQYQIQVAQPTFLEASQVVLDTTLGDSLQSFRNFIKILNPNVYQWRVRGLNSNFSTDYSTQSFEVLVPVDGDEQVDLSMESVMLLAPFNNAVLNDTNVTFSWDSVSEATSYRFQIAFPNFENPEQLVIDQSFDMAGSQSFDLEDNTSYEWRVKALNETSETAYTTRDVSINATEDLSEQTVIIVAPEDAFETSETSVGLSWDSLEQATLYRVLITDLSDNTIFLEQTTTEANLTVTFEVGEYTWAVRAENDTESTPFTEQTITIIE
jgi:hypothetical protein